jgi:hypothetical protein
MKRIFRLFTFRTTKMADPIQIICSITGCTQEEADHAYDMTQDVTEAVDMILEKITSPAEKYINSKKKRRVMTPEEEVIGPYRKILKELDEKMSTSLHQHGYEGSVEKKDHPEETVPQSNCFQQCQLPSLEEGVQKLEIACQLPSECSCGLPSSDQKLPCSDPGCSRSNQDLN